MQSRSPRRVVWVVRASAIGLFVIMLVIWIVCQGDFVVWSRPIDTQITVQHGYIEWLSRRHYVLYSPDEMFAASFVLAVSTLVYRYLRTAFGLALLAIAVHMVVLNVANYPANFLLVIFDVGLFTLANRGFNRPKVRDPNFCIKCGYDLRATPERCPECGTSVWRPLPTPESSKPSSDRLSYRSDKPDS